MCKIHVVEHGPIEEEAFGDRIQLSNAGVYHASRLAEEYKARASSITSVHYAAYWPAEATARIIARSLGLLGQVERLERGRGNTSEFLAELERRLSGLTGEALVIL